nr:hypothetical protein [Candidatus Anammoximicrobium sp.]
MSRIRSFLLLACWVAICSGCGSARIKELTAEVESLKARLSQAEAQVAQLQAEKANLESALANAQQEQQLVA